MTGHGEKWSRKHDQALVALLSQPTIPAAATAAGISESTMLRWLQREDFQSRYRAARRQVVEAAIAALQAATSEAVTTLRDVMTDPTAPASSRVTAAKHVLDTSIAAVEMTEVIERIERLEAVAATHTQNGHAKWRA